MRKDLPVDWHKFYETKAHFVAYYGDIYSGHLYDFSGHPESTFVIPNVYKNNLIGKSSIPREKLDVEAWEIKDHNIIRSIWTRDPLGSQMQIPENRRLGSRDWKKMFVFGAGASKFCMPKSEEPRLDNTLFSPLANELFDPSFASTMQRYPGVQLIRPRLNLFKNDIETFFESEWVILRNSYKPSLLARHINFRYYLQDLFGAISRSILDEFSDCNLYPILLDSLQKRLTSTLKEQIAFVSFNYDTILDTYLQSIFSTNFTTINDYVQLNSSPVLLFKPHGSHNWGWKFSRWTINNTHGIPSWLYENQFTLDKIYYELLDNSEHAIHARSFGIEGKYTINKQLIQVINDYSSYYLPALLVPYQLKDEFVMPYHHREALAWFMSEMTDLYLVGWKGNERSFNTLLSQNAHRLQRITIVNPNVNDVKDSLSPYLDLSKYEILPFDSFEQFVSQFA